MKLAEWIQEQGLTQLQAGQNLRLGQGHISALCRGGIWPSRGVSRRIWHVTNGLVTPNDFLWEDGTPEAKFVEERSGPATEPAEDEVDLWQGERYLGRIRMLPVFVPACAGSVAIEAKTRCGPKS